MNGCRWIIWDEVNDFVTTVAIKSKALGMDFKKFEGFIYGRTKSL